MPDLPVMIDEIRVIAPQVDAAMGNRIAAAVERQLADLHGSGPVSADDVRAAAAAGVRAALGRAVARTRIEVGS